MEYFNNINLPFKSNESKLLNTLNSPPNFYKSIEDEEKTLTASEKEFEILEFDINDLMKSRNDAIVTDEIIIEEIFEGDKNFNKIEENLSEFLQIGKGKEKNQNFSCLLCNLSFKTKFNLETHFWSLKHQKTENEFIAAEQNGNERLSIDEMIVEDAPDDMNISNYEVHTCHECQAIFPRISDLKNHKRIKHSSFKCQECNRRYKNQKDYEEHIQRHQKSKDFKCETCGKFFTNNQNLKRHERAHNGVKKFECLVCGHKFDQKSNLVRHSKIHEVSVMYEVRTSYPRNF